MRNSAYNLTLTEEQKQVLRPLLQQVRRAGLDMLSISTDMKNLRMWKKPGKHPGPVHSFERARKSIKRLKIQGAIEYYKRYKEDPMLPSRPEEYYLLKGWQGWRHFCDTKFYEYEEARILLRKKGITTPGQYRKLREKDRKLPGTPSTAYKEWIDFYTFLGIE